MSDDINPQDTRASVVTIDAPGHMAKPEVLDLLKKADVIMGVQRFTEEVCNILFGEEIIEEIAKGRGAEFGPVTVVKVNCDPDTEELECLCAAVQSSKGYYSYGGERHYPAPSSEMVRIYDFATKKVAAIPAAELAPGMTEAEVKGVGRVWVNAAQGRVGRIRHQPFTEEIRQQIRSIKESMDEVYPKTLKEWEDGFRKDAHPEREIEIWEHIASVYQSCTALRESSPEQRRDYFDVILSCSMNPREHVLEVVQLRAISHQEAVEVMALFYASVK